MATFGILLDLVSALTALRVFQIAESGILIRPELLIPTIYLSLIAIYKLGKAWNTPDWLISGLMSIIIVATYYPGVRNLLLIIGVIPSQVKEFYFHEFNLYTASGFNKMFYLFVMEMLILIPAWLTFTYFHYSVRKAKERLVALELEKK